MPELPEVETIRKDLAKAIVGLTIQRIDIYDDRVIKGSRTDGFVKGLKNARISQISRRGKAIIIECDQQGFLIVQPKMTGQLIIGRHLRREDHLKDTKVVFHLSNGRYLNYNDQRLFGWLHFVKTLEQVDFLNRLGPEPLSKTFNAKLMFERLKGRSAPIKTLLMNQYYIAGIGNIYASEICFSAKVSPLKRADLLTSKEVQKLYRSTVDILTEAIKFRGSSMRNYRDASGEKGTYNQRVQVYARDEQPCYLCQQLIKRIVQAGRSTFYCEGCQT